MRDRRNYHNLFDSICVTFLLFVCLAFYFLILWFGVLNPKEETNPIATMIISTVFFSIMMTITVILIVKGCYEYWILSDDFISSKKPFSKKVVIRFVEIEKVEKKFVPALILGVYKCEAYIIHSKGNKITILTNKGKSFSELNFKLRVFLNKEE